MTNIEKSIITSIENYVGHISKNWYVGVSEEPRNRLTSHGVKMNKPYNTLFLYENAQSSTAARNIERYFIDKGMDGGDGGGDQDAIYIYVFLKPEKFEHN